jgi:hypothetical protein
VQVHELQPLQTQQSQAALDGTPHLLAREVSGRGVAVGLRGEHAVLGQASHLLEHLAYAPLALPVAVGGGGVEEI